jgi:hypothetical protein
MPEVEFDVAGKWPDRMDGISQPLGRYAEFASPSPQIVTVSDSNPPSFNNGRSRFSCHRVEPYRKAPG